MLRQAVLLDGETTATNAIWKAALRMQDLSVSEMPGDFKNANSSANVDAPADVEAKAKKAAKNRCARVAK